VRLKDVTAENLAKQTGLATKAVREGLARLATLGYVVAGGGEGNTYRAVAR
jgi:DNA-binding FadR family transcriptional regulator